MKKPSHNNSTLEKLTSWVGSTASLVVHTIIFLCAFSLVFFGISLETILLVVTTIVSLEAIYLAIFIQMTVNKNTESLKEVEEDVDEIQEDIDAIQVDVDEIQDDIDEIQEDVGEMSEEEKAEIEHSKMTDDLLTKIKDDLAKIIADVEKIKK